MGAAKLEPGSASELCDFRKPKLGHRDIQKLLQTTLESSGLQVSLSRGRGGWD